MALGAAGDLVVPGGIAANLAPSDSRILPSSIGTAAHGDLPNRDRTTREIALAVNGMPLGCQSLGEAIRSFATAEAVRVGQAGAALAAAGVSMSPAAQIIAGTGSEPR